MQLGVEQECAVQERAEQIAQSMLLRLRQITSHIFMLQETMEEMFKLEDIENLRVFRAHLFSLLQLPH